MPVCVDMNLYARQSRTLQAAVVCIEYLCLRRPRLCLPRLLAALEAGYEMPELPMRVTRPLMALAQTCTGATSLRLSLCWNIPEMGRQPADQPSSILSPQQGLGAEVLAFCFAFQLLFGRLGRNIVDCG